MKYTILALDLDGTLTNAKKEITEKTKLAIHAAIKKGVLIILASGRPVLGIQRLADELNLPKLGGFILAYNGGQIIDCKTGKTIFQNFIPMEYYHNICKCGHLYDVHTLTYDENGVVAESDVAPYVQKEAYNNTIAVRKVESLENAVTKPVTKFMIVGEPDKLSYALEYMHKKFDGKLSVFLSEPYFMEVAPLGIEKATALEKLLGYLHIDKSHLMACGDGLNDIPMLQYAGLAVAMGNAYSETKKYADYITLTNEDDGVAVVVEKFILNE